MNQVFLWLFLLAALGVYAWWQIRENRRLANRWRLDLDEVSARWLTRLVSSRTVQAISGLALCIVIIMAYDWQLRASRAEYTANLQIEAAEQEKLIVLETEAKEAEAREAALKEELSKAVVVHQTGFYPSAPTAAESNAVQAATTISPQGAGGIVELYNPEDSSPGNQSALDRIKKRYEDILVNYMFLKKCGEASDTDYHVIISALSQEMASINAPGRLQYDIVTAAQGSYKEIYAKSSCRTTESVQLIEQYKNYIATIAKQYTAP